MFSTEVESPVMRKKDHGVDFTIDSSLDSQFLEKPIAINERLMSRRIPLSKKHYVTLISAYANYAPPRRRH